jgi:hypothetical protein
MRKRMGRTNWGGVVLQIERMKAAKWDAEMIPCRNHPDRRCKRSGYARGYRLCSACWNRPALERRVRLFQEEREAAEAAEMAEKS